MRRRVVAKIVELEQSLFSLRIPAYGSIYYNNRGFKTKTVDIVADGIPTIFCVGPSTEQAWWYRDRDQLGVTCGPCKYTLGSLTLSCLIYRGTSSTEVSKAVAERELAWLRTFGKPRFPAKPFYIELYNYRKVLPELHTQNLIDYLEIIFYLVPEKKQLNRPTLCHLNLALDNVIISESGDIICVIGWQHSVSLPFYLETKIPRDFQKDGDNDDANFQLPKAPDLESLTGEETDEELEDRRRRHAQYFYLGYSSDSDRLHLEALLESNVIFWRKIHEEAGRPWDGDSISLKAKLIASMMRWAYLALQSSPDSIKCPLNYSMEEIDHCYEIYTPQMDAADTSQDFHKFVGATADGWMSTEDHQNASQIAAKLKVLILAVTDTDTERRKIAKHRPFDEVVQDGIMVTSERHEVKAA
jgi:hypothetical protein